MKPVADASRLPVETAKTSRDRGMGALDGFETVTSVDVVGGAGETSNAPLVADVSPDAEAVIVNAVPAWLTAQPAKDATPAAAVLVRPPVQVRVPDPLSVRVITVVLSLVMVAVAADCTATTG
jgi:hypothetical protein